MKKLWLFLLPVLLLAACTRSAVPVEEVPTDVGEDPLAEFIQAASTDEVPVPTAVVNDSGGGTDADATVTPFIVTPEEPPTETPTPLPTERPTDGPVLPSATPTQATPVVPPFDPFFAYGQQPRFDKTFLTVNNWAESSGNLPNTSNIRLELVSGGNLKVTGTNSNQAHAWWFSAVSLGDLYVEIEVHTADPCNAKSSYGLFLDAPQSGAAGGAHGYIVALTCDGRYTIERVDATRDSAGRATYEAVNFFRWEQSEYIAAGPNKTNRLGVLIQDGQISLFINRYLAVTFYDDTYDEGRVGVYVDPRDDPNYAYTISDFLLWDLRENR